MPATNPVLHADAETTGLTAAEQAFVHAHAAAWTRIDADRGQAIAYADWYAAEHIPRARSMNDLPAHTHAWRQYLDSQAECDGE